MESECCALAGTDCRPLFLRRRASRPQLKRDPLGRDEHDEAYRPPRTSLQAHMLYVIVENFRGGDAVPVYRRFRDRGRLAPDGLRYHSSWVTADFRRCFQVMECNDPTLLEQWMANWRDLVDFEVIPVQTSADASAAIGPRL